MERPWRWHRAPFCTCEGGRTCGDSLVEPGAPAAPGPPSEPTSAPVTQTRGTPQGAGHPSGGSRAREAAPRGSHAQNARILGRQRVDASPCAGATFNCCHGSARTAGRPGLSGSAQDAGAVSSLGPPCGRGSLLRSLPAAAGPSRAPRSWPAVPGTKCAFSDTGKTAPPLLSGPGSVRLVMHGSATCRSLAPCPVSGW